MSKDHCSIFYVNTVFFLNSFDFFKMDQCNQDLSVMIVKSEAFETDMLKNAAKCRCV